MQRVSEEARRLTPPDDVRDSHVVHLCTRDTMEPAEARIACVGAGCSVVKIFKLLFIPHSARSVVASDEVNILGLIIHIHT